MKRISLIFVWIMIVTAGCANTLWRYYEAPESSAGSQVNDHIIGFTVGSYEIGNIEGHPLFRVKAEVESIVRYENVAQAAEAPIPWIDSVLLLFPGHEGVTVLSLKPGVPKNVDDVPIIWKNRLLSTFFFEDLILPEPPRTVKLSFELVIMDRTTHEVIRRIPVERDLILISKKKFWIHT